MPGKKATRIRPLRQIADLTLDPQNANTGTPRGRKALTHSLTEFGAARSIVADRHGVVIAGNKTLAEATALALPIAVVQTTGDRLVVVQRTDLDFAADDRARRLALADNRVGELDLAWNADHLRAHVADGIDLQEFWTTQELEQFFGEGLRPGTDDPDRVIEPRPTAIRVGDRFALGAHRVICGDATDPHTVTRVLEGDQPVLMTTDPPYGVQYDPAWRAGLNATGRTATGRVANDDRIDWSAAWALFAGDVLYVWHAGLFAGEVARSIQDVGFDLRAQIIWSKSHFAMSRGHYHWQHEPCWYAVRRGTRSRWTGDRTQTTVWEVPTLNPIGGARDRENVVTGHSTQKPVRLFEMPILNHTRIGEAIYDPFVGSGSSLIAAEKTGRRCVAIDLDPRYVQATIDRWEAYTGGRAERLDGGDAA